MHLAISFRQLDGSCRLRYSPGSPRGVRGARKPTVRSTDPGLRATRPLPGAKPARRLRSVCRVDLAAARPHKEVPMNASLVRQLRPHVAEFIGTFALVFIGC